MTLLNKILISVAVTSIAISCNDQQLRPLPFYLSPDLTPVWVTKTTDSFKRIHTIPAFSFIDQNGEQFTEKNMQGKICVVNFIFTSCGSICPRMTQNFSILQNAFLNDDEIMLISQTVNPERDSVATLKKYAVLKKIDYNKWKLLTGTKTDLYTLAKKEYFAGDSIGYYGDLNAFLHTEKVYLIDKERRIRGVYNGTLSIEMDRIKEDIATLKKE